MEKKKFDIFQFFKPNKKFNEVVNRSRIFNSYLCVNHS